MHWMDWTGGGWLMMIVWWVVLVGAIVVGVKWLSDQRSQPTKEESALEILKKRYARGEISKEEFEEKRDQII